MTRDADELRQSPALTKTAGIRSPARWSTAIIVLVAMLHGIACHFIARTTSATYDEPMHAFSGALTVQRFDFRAGFDHPPLIHVLAGLAQVGNGARIDPAAPFCQRLAAEPIVLWNATVDQLYRRPEIDGAAFVDRARVPMPFVAAIAVLLTGLCTRAIAGGRAGVLAATVMALDPNLLAHGGLVKNDVAIAACFIGVAWVAWCTLVVRMTLPRTVTLGALFGLALLTKFSGALLIACVLLTLFAHAITTPTVDSPTRRTRPQRIGRWAGNCLLMLLVAYVVVWVGYGFAYFASPAGALDPIRTQVFVDLYHQRSGRSDLPMSMKLILRANEHHLLPEAFLNGLIYQSVTVLGRLSYLFGCTHVGGSICYFPVAWLVKTPIGTVALVAIAGWLLVRRVARAMRDSAARSRSAVWAIGLFGTIVVAYVIASVVTPLNIGVRHLFPIYPFIYAGLGWATSRLLAQSSRWRALTIALIGVTALETIAATPNQLSFVNAVARTIRPANWWLSDSNLDWGQGLRALATWQRDGHDDRPLYLAYFGIADPAAYGVQYVNLPNGSPTTSTPGLNLGGYVFGPAADAPDFTARPGYLAVSITQLQGIGVGGDPFLAFRDQTPIVTLAGSIEIFDTRTSPIETLARPRVAIGH